MTGPPPNPDARRRNPPAIPTTKLPASGRKGRPPNCPYELAKAGKAWWKWAWGTPQACAWSPGDLYAIARRAQLEDDVAAMDSFEEFDLANLLDAPLSDFERGRELELIVSKLKALAGGRLAIAARMGELDKRLGLDPKAMVELRWKIVSAADTKSAPATPPADTAKDKLPSNVRRIRPADPALAADA